jgi:hypothetical protein
VNAKRLTLLTAAGLAVSGCGATAVLDSASRGTPTAAVPSSAAPTSSIATATATATPAATPVPTPAPAPAPPPPPAQVIVTAAENDFSGSTFQVTLISTGGTVLASAAVPSDARWSVGSGSGAAYWVTAGKLQKLDAHGVVKTLAIVPSNEAGRVVVSPDGTEVAYATMTQNSKGVATNRLYRVGSSGASMLIAQRIADPAHASADAPPDWQYYPMSWTSKGILIERQPLGGCGCGAPFDMQMSAGYSAFIDPGTGTATPVTESNTCPLAGAATDGTAACFERSSTGGSASIDFLDNMRTTARFALTGMNLGGDVTFNGSTVAYATVPKNAGGCGGPDWSPLTTLRLMDVRTGNAHAVGPLGFAPQSWLRDGTIVGTISVAAHSTTGSTTSTVVVLDPTSGHVSTILNRSALVVGVA